MNRSQFPLGPLEVPVLRATMLIVTSPRRSPLKTIGLKTSVPSPEVSSGSAFYRLAMFVCGNTSPSSGATTPTKKQSSSPLLDDVDHVLAFKSDEEKCKLLRSMVGDLLTEVDLLRDRLEETESSVVKATKERDHLNNDCKEKIRSLTLLIKNEGSSIPGMSNQSAETDTTKLIEGEVLSAERATELVIQALKAKVEQLNVENSQLVDAVKAMRERAEDLESENDARLHKISALEAQFKAINKTRQKVVSNLVDRSNDSRLIRA